MALKIRLSTELRTTLPASRDVYRRAYLALLSVSRPEDPDPNVNVGGA